MLAVGGRPHISVKPAAKNRVESFCSPKDGAAPVSPVAISLPSALNVLGLWVQSLSRNWSKRPLSRDSEMTVALSFQHPRTSNTVVPSAATCPISVMNVSPFTWSSDKEIALPSNARTTSSAKPCP